MARPGDLRKLGIAAVVRHIGQDQAAFGRELVAVGAERLAVQRQRDEIELLAIEMQRCAWVGNLRVAPDPEARFDPGVSFAKLEDEVDGIDQEGRRPVIGQSDGLGRGDIRGNIKHQRTALISKEGRSAYLFRRFLEIP